MSQSIALLVGLDYHNADEDARIPELHGTILDVRHVRDHLKTIGFTDITVLTDGRKPVTRKDFKKTLRNFLRRPALEYVIFYSGHGTNYASPTASSEPEDEFLVMSDGFVMDDEIRDILSEAPKEARIVVIADCCHSGTICDLQYNYQSPTDVQFDANMKAIDAKILLLSGCRDDQTSAEGPVDWLYPDRRVQSGYMTAALLKVLRDRPQMRNRALELFGAVQTLLFSKAGAYQIPQLSASFRLDQSTPFF